MHAYTIRTDMIKPLVFWLDDVKERPDVITDYVTDKEGQEIPLVAETDKGKTGYLSWLWGGNNDNHYKAKYLAEKRKYLEYRNRILDKINN